MFSIEGSIDKSKTSSAEDAFSIEGSIDKSKTSSAEDAFSIEGSIDKSISSTDPVESGSSEMGSIKSICLDWVDLISS